MELTRRDAAAALAAIGATGGVAIGVRRAADDEATDASWDGEGPPDDKAVREAMTAVARTVYPEDVSGVDEFVEGFLDGRLDGSAHETGIKEAVDEVESAARSWYDAPVADL
ncbi:MAG: gluconate 2-dehydrogenase subunit 3 family protein, partial [Halorubrum sp.]